MDDPSVLSPRRPRFVLTNRMNLNGILSSRIVGPRDSFTKYYQDLLQLTGGPVAILAQPPDEDLVRYVSEKVRTGPALLELEASTDVADVRLVELVTAFPFARVTAVHLPDEASLREHLARRYANVHTHDELLRVSPDLFGGTASRDDLRSSVTEPTPPLLGFQHWQRMDRVRGAMSAAIFAAATPDDLQIAASLLPGSRDEGWLGRYLRSEETTATDADAHLMHAVTDILVRTDMRKAWNPLAILDEVRQAVTNSSEAAIHLNQIEANLAPIAAILSNERSFTPFRESGRALKTAKALLLFLLRPELSELLSWAPSETGADTGTRQLSAVMAGLLRGLSREACSLRSVVIDDYTAAWACSDDSPTDNARSESVLVTLSETDEEATLIVGGQQVRRVPLVSYEPEDLFRALPERLRQDLAPALVAALQASDAVKIKVRSSRFDVTADESSGLVITLPGEATVEYCYDLEALADKISDASLEQLQVVMPLLGDPSTGPKTTAK